MTATDLKGSKKSIPKPDPTNGHTPFTKRHTVTSLQESRVRLQFEYEADRYEAVYNKAAITVAFGRRMFADEEQTQGEQAVAVLSVLLLDWDLVQEDGETPLPPSVEALEGLPTEFLGKLLQAIWSDVNPPETPAADSGSFS